MSALGQKRTSEQVLPLYPSKQTLLKVIGTCAKSGHSMIAGAANFDGPARHSDFAPFLVTLLGRQPMKEARGGQFVSIQFFL